LRGGGGFGAIRLAWQQTSEKEYSKSVEQLSKEKFAKMGVGKPASCC